MALTEIGTNVIAGERYDTTITLPITDSTTITAGDFVELSSGKLIKSITTLSTSLVGIAATTKAMGVLATAGQQEYVGVVTEGIIKVKGLVENTGAGTYITAIAVGTKVSFHYDVTAGYGQFVVNSTAAPIGIVIHGSVASAGASDDAWDYVLVQLDFEAIGSGGADIADGAVSTAKLATSAVTIAKTAVAVPQSLLNATIRYSIDGGSYTLNATLGTLTQTFSSTLSTTAGAVIMLTSSSTVTIVPTYGSLSKTNFVITGDVSAVGSWAAFVRC